MEMTPWPRLDFLRAVFIADHSAGTDNLTRTTKKTEHIPTKTTIRKNGPYKQQRLKKHAKIYDRLRQTDIRPGLVAFYVIRPENGAGLFLQPQNPHEANAWTKRPNM